MKGSTNILDRRFRRFVLAGVAAVALVAPAGAQAADQVGPPGDIRPATWYDLSNAQAPYCCDYTTRRRLAFPTVLRTGGSITAPAADQVPAAGPAPVPAPQAPVASGFDIGDAAVGGAVGGVGALLLAAAGYVVGRRRRLSGSLIGSHS